MISSTSNPQIKNLIQLQTKAKERQEQNAFVVEGIKMFEEARDGGHLIKAYVTEALYKEKLEENQNYFTGVPHEVVTEQVMKAASDTLTPQGVLAVVRRKEYELSDFIHKPSVTLLLLEDLRDPGNLGTIIRTAEGAGVNGIILSQSSVDIYNPKVIRSTMGGIYRMPFVYVPDFYKAIQEIKAAGISVYAAHLKAAVEYDSFSYPEKSAILIGNEARGLSEAAAELSSYNIIIPMEGKVESLNAGVAAALLMYEIYRQKRHKLETD
ncbi:TrmH family RNA methyltransferase [Anaerocolumna chitinilytica]|uniref:RNA methyltransferase n=1 Tax=Anaerocolumna chitinilytica TaxID=1727145 RepID=A0A7I8DGC3_9FIRM|nr:RNA methyltransferase [Anaerocolumna chitinilytica]BCJ97440.1 RNA methyltransferase [Anaerocolumna chitinilytica]